MVQNGSLWVQNSTKYESGQNIPKQSWANNLMFEYIRIFWMNIFIRKNIRWFFLGRIYSDIHLWSFYHAEYIRIFIRPISMVTNIFWCSFVQKIYIRPTLLECYSAKVVKLFAFVIQPHTPRNSVSPVISTFILAVFMSVCRSVNYALTVRHHEINFYKDIF